MRWSTVCGEIPSRVAISFEERCSSTRRRQSSCPGESRATRSARESSFAGLPWWSAESGKPPVSFKAKPTPRDICATPEQRVRRNLYVMSRDLASFLRILAASIYIADSSGLKSRNFGFAEVAGELMRSERFLAAKSVLEPETVRECWWGGLDSNSQLLGSVRSEGRPRRSIEAQAAISSSSMGYTPLSTSSKCARTLSLHSQESPRSSSISRIYNEPRRVSSMPRCFRVRSTRLM